MNQTYVTLNDGNKIPQSGLGVHMIMGDALTKEACLEALENTSQLKHNIDAVRQNYLAAINLF